jgi:dipeptidyl aminopeptidase/acylaminoacyl peptidase
MRRIGIDFNDEAAVRRISPFFNADRVKSPLLIFQGANDPRVKIAEAEQMVQALRDNKRSVEFIVYPDGGHGSWGGASFMEQIARMEAFLAKHLGGRAEPFAPIPGSTAQVR